MNGFYSYCRLICVATVLLISQQVRAEPELEPSKLQPDNVFPQVKLVTNMGTVLVELDRTKAPITVDNFLKYVVTKQYNNTVFHRVIKDFVVQGGGLDEKYNPLEDLYEPIHNEAGNGLKNEAYTLAMARQGHPHSATRQFYFNVSNNKSLDPGSRSWGYAVFGRVIEGEDVIDKIAQVETGVNTDLGWPDVPVTPVILREAILLPTTAK